MSTHDEQLEGLRELYADWGAAKKVLDAVESDIALLEFQMGYTDYAGGPKLMKRVER